VGLTNSVPTRLLALEEAELWRLSAAYPGDSHHVIDVGTDRGRDHEIFAAARKNALVARKNLDAELVSQIVQMTWLPMGERSDDADP